jgi:DNA-directed RNA polymerase delta subunit
MPEEKASAPDARDAVLDELYAKRDEIDVAISAILFLKGSGATAPETSARRVASGNGLSIPSNAFFSLGIGDAAKKYLELVQAKKTLPQIVKGLEDGGMPAQKPNTVYAALRRRESVTGDIMRVGEEWGLKEWFSNIPKPKPAKIAKGKRSKKKATKKAASKTASKKPASTPEAQETKQAESAEPAGKGAKTATGKTISNLDAAYKILTDTGAPVHADKLAEQINAAYGKKTHGKSLAASLPDDSTQRFDNIGNNTWTLREWPDEKKVKVATATA